MVGVLLVSRPSGWGKSGYSKHRDIPVPHAHASTKFRESRSISGSLPALATAGSGGRWHFFCSRNTQLWLQQQQGRPPCSGPLLANSRNGVPIGDEFFCPRHANVEHSSSKIGRPTYRPRNPRPSDAVLCDRFSGMVVKNAESFAFGISPQA